GSHSGRANDQIANPSPASANRKNQKTARLALQGDSSDGGGAGAVCSYGLFWRGGGLVGGMFTVLAVGGITWCVSFCDNGRCGSLDEPSGLARTFKSNFSASSGGNWRRKSAR